MRIMQMSGILRLCSQLAFLAVTVFFLSANINAQEAGWTVSIGGPYTDRGHSIVKSDDGGYVVAGRTDTVGFGDPDLYLFKVDSQGTLLWSRNYGDAFEYEEGRSLDKTSDGGYILVGDLLVKTNSMGIQQWRKPISGWSVEQTDDGGYIIGGSEFNGTDSMDFKLTKTNAVGVIAWTEYYGGSGMQYGYQARQLPGGGYVIVGYGYVPGLGNQALIIRTNAAGDSLSGVRHGGSGNEVAYDVRQTSDGGYILTGFTTSYGGGADMYLLKTSAFGGFQWENNYGSSNFDDIAYSVQLTADTGYIIAGQTDTSSGDEWDVYVVKTDDLGNEIWSKKYGGGGAHNGRGIVETSKLWYTVAGYNDSDAWLVRIIPSPLIIVVYGPVNVLVTDPVGDRLGYDEQGFYYSEIWPANYYEFANDSVVINKPLLGTYTLEFSYDPGADTLEPLLFDGSDKATTYSAIIKIDGTLAVTVAADEDVGVKSVIHTYKVQEGYHYLNGDANRDESVNLADAGYIINYIFYDGPAPYPLFAGDANCDNSTNLGDAGFIINYIFYSGPPPCYF